MPPEPPAKRYKKYLRDEDEPMSRTSTWRLNSDVGNPPRNNNNEAAIIHQLNEEDEQRNELMDDAVDDDEQQGNQNELQNNDNIINEPQDEAILVNRGIAPDNDEEQIHMVVSDREFGEENVEDSSSTGDEVERDRSGESSDTSQIEERRQLQSATCYNHPPTTSQSNRPRVLHEELEIHQPEMRETEVAITQNFDYPLQNEEEQILYVDLYTANDDYDDFDEQQNVENYVDPSDNNDYREEEDDHQQANVEGDDGDNQQEADNTGEDGSAQHQGDGDNAENAVDANPPTHTKLRQAIQKEDFTAPISRPVNASQAEVILMTLAMAQQNNFTFKAFVDSVKLLNSIFISPVLPKSGYLLDKLLNSSEGIVNYYYCSSCSFSFGNRDSSIDPVLVCTECNFSNEISDPTKASYFVLYPLGPQIELLFMDEEIRKNLSDPKDLTGKGAANCMNDLYDGQCYKDFVASLPEGAQKIISFIVSTDGSPLFKSSNFSIWPFFISINELPPLLRMKHLLLAGLWFGNKKPHMDLYLEPLEQHLRKLEAGFLLQFNGEEATLFAYTIGCCVDSGARGAVQGLNTHSGYFSCNWCEIPGEYCEHKVVFPFPEIPPKKRTHVTVEEQARECVADEKLAYVCGVQFLSPLANLSKFDIVNGMILDFAHNVPFGISRTLLVEWLTNTSRGYYIGAPDDIQELDKKILSLTPPIEIRKPVRKVSDHSNWSAREYDNWTSIFSLMVLYGIQQLKYATHWSHLVQGVFLLMRQKVTHEDINNAYKLLLHFERDIEQLYGKSFMSYNIHIMGHHMAENAVRWGPAWAASTFCFESGIKDLKGIIHAQRGVPHQIHRSLSFKQAAHLLRNSCKSEKTDAFETGLASKPNKRTKYLPVAECALVGSPSEFTPTPEENYLLENFSEFDIDISSLSVYNKMIARRCVYTTDHVASGKRYNNSCASTIDNKLIIIKKIVLDTVSERVLIFCVEVLADTFLRIPQGIRISPTDHCLRTVTSIGRRLMLLPVTHLKIVNFITKMNDETYVGEFPNVYNVF